MSKYPKDIVKWRKMKDKGMLRFIILFGFLGFGITSSIVAFFIERIWEYGVSFSSYFNTGWGRALLESFIQWMITGLIWGIFMWLIFVRRLGK